MLVGSNAVVGALKALMFVAPVSNAKLELDAIKVKPLSLRVWWLSYMLV